MFKTSQPNPDHSDKTRAGFNKGKAKQFKTLEEFSAWLDEQLLKLESSHDGFLTSKSVRKFFKRS